MQDKIRFLTKIFGKAKLQNNGIELMIPCPKCYNPSKAHKLKMNIRLDNDLYHCWSCNLKGRNLGRLIKMKRPEMAVQYFEKFSRGFSQKDIAILAQVDPVVLPEGFSLIMMNLYDPDAIRIRKYAHSRGIDDKMLWKYCMGYSSEWKYLRRLIIPSFDSDGELNYWVSRSIDSENKYKYFNAKAKKEDIIFREIDIDWSAEEIILVEGPLDWVKCGYKNSACLLGSSISIDSKLLMKLVQNSMDVILCLDPDAWKKQLDIARLLSEYDLRVYLASPDSGDVGDLDYEGVEQLIKNKIEYDREYGSISHMINKL